ncbi:GRAM domain-containing protein 4-like [Dendronephthya gigantea]|uniref:GRAM domain-containing protein 4-like n=1 Tax=Dendronephthya gigantea TaxID=151771 RepID=UPI00106D128F|nr:GRAM domain-containing protein 4-like [Dendronephthya gigantea]XP_028398162.1 GRAM domain-containing protein 4-like [Dendronephthya gigantea]
MSSGSDWVNLFVHQGKEFIDSVSGQKKKEGLTNETKREDQSNPANAGILYTNNSVNGSVSLVEENDGGSDVKAKTGMSLEAEASTSSVEKVALTQGEKEIYENQLDQLQEQLVDIMIKNQEMDAELSMLRDSDVCKLTKELEREKIKRKQLEVKLKKVKHESDNTPKLRRRRQHHEESTSESLRSADGVIATSSNQYEIPKDYNKSRVSRFKFWVYCLYVSLTQRITITFWNILSDLSDEETPQETGDENGPPLAVKTLKDNINRFSSGIKPIKEFLNKVTWVLSWKNPAATMLIFLVYVFSFWHGLSVSLLLFLVIVQLSANFVYSRFGTISDTEKTESAVDPPSWSDRFQVVLHVARKVQNVLGNLSDYLEKVKNLITWKVPHVTFKLYIVLWLLFLSSIFLTGPHFYMLLGMVLGYKLFILGPLYNRFPKLKKRHDATHRLWLELPTDCEVAVAEKQTGAIDERQDSSIHRSGVSPVSETSAMNSLSFCQRYDISSDEVLVKGWEEGWRASLMNKNRPLVDLKHGRLYLTQNYLCFERSRTNLAKNILMKLSDIRCVNKFKPIYFLPGTGMSIEVCMKDKDEPYIFAAMVGRDDAYNDIMQMARNTELSWAK